MGTTKQLLPFLDKPAIFHCLEPFWKAGFSRPVVVLSPEGAEISRVLGDFPVTIAWNDESDCEMADSVRTGLKAASASCSAFIICPADYLLVSSSTVAGLTEGHEADPGSIIIPVFKGKRGHPVLFPRFMLEELDSGLTLRDIISNHSDKVFHYPVEDEGILFDMDTPSDYEALCRKASFRKGRP